MIDELPSSPTSGFVRPAVLLAGCVLAIALLLSPIAVTKSGSNGPIGLALAAAICLGTGWLAEGVASVLQRSVSPLALMLLGMALRMVPPLGICLVLAAQAANGREHLPFLLYLMTFYFVMLALETWLTVKRVARTSPDSIHRAR